LTLGHAVNLLVLLAVVAGHLVIVRGLIGRAYRSGMPRAVWFTVGGVLGAAAVAVPWAMVVRVGRHGPHVLRGGRWRDAPAGWQLYAGACLAVLLLTWLARLRPRKVAALLAQRGETIDVGARLGTPPVGRGARAWLARLPGNELFHVELAEREIALPGLPRRLDGLSVLHLSDLHFNGTPGRPFFEHALELAAGLKAGPRRAHRRRARPPRHVRVAAINAGAAAGAAGVLLRPRQSRRLRRTGEDPLGAARPGLDGRRRSRSRRFV
jgi:hypothetical protein